MFISFVILTWNSEKTIKDSIDSISSTMDKNSIDNYEVFVVDNGSRDSSGTMLKEYSAKDDRFKIVMLETNKGTTISRNLVLKKVQGDYICIMDSDTIIEEWNVHRSVDFLKKSPALIAPRIRYPNGIIQNSVKKYPTLTDKILKLPKIIFGYDKLAKMDFYKDISFDSIARVETAISAFWLFPNFFLNDVGLLDENIFYSPEDLDYCVRVQKAGYPIYYYPEIKCIHVTQQISHKRAISRISISHFLGLLYYFMKHKYLFSAAKLRRKNGICYKEVD